MPKCERCKSSKAGMIHVECEGYVCADCLLAERSDLRTEVERLQKENERLNTLLDGKYDSEV